MTLVAKIQPKATMGESWAESDRLRVKARALWVKQKKLLAKKGGYLSIECDRLGDEAIYLQMEGNLIVILTAQTLYGKDAQIDWVKRVVTAGRESGYDS